MVNGVIKFQDLAGPLEKWLKEQKSRINMQTNTFFNNDEMNSL